MLFNRIDVNYLLIGAALITVGVIHYMLARMAAWAGAIVPVLYVGFIGWLLATGQISGPIDLALLTLGLLALLSYWSKARSSVSRRT